MADADALIVFTPSGRRGRFPVGTPVLAAARALGVDVDSVCGGRAMCGRCQVTVMEGDFTKHGVKSRRDHLSPVTVTETSFSRRRPMPADRRLSCQAQILGDLVIDVPASSQVHRQVIRKAADEREITLNPVVSLHYVEVTEPDMHNPASDLQRLCLALEREWQLKDLDCDFPLLQRLQPVLRQGKWAVTVAVHARQSIIAIWPGFHERAYGLAVDVGSTTIAMHLCDLLTGNVLATSGAMNPQIRFGEDLMSRVSYSMMNPEGAAQMTAAVRGALNDLIAQVARDAGAQADEILEAAIVGNPIMHHLLLGIDPVELGGAPFALCTDGSVTARAAQLELKMNPNARVYVLPCIAGHVGADTAGVILAERPDLRDELTLLVDVGTNAEIVLGNKDRLLACSSPTGPAFEGAQISGGQRAAPGAIERVRIDPATLEPRFKVIGSDLWSNEPGFDEATAATGITGICGSGIIEVIAEMYLAGIISQDGVVQGALAARSDRVVASGRTYSYVLHRGAATLQISQNDVRAIQLAKAALYAGIKLLMEHLGVEQVDRIRLAGAFGAHIDVKYAMVLGMIPDCDLAQVTSAGNAAGAGARIALLDEQARSGIEKLVRRVEKIETAIEPRFQQHFVEAMAIPHKTAAYDRLREAVRLPPPIAAEPGEGSRPRGRRPVQPRP
ncbi:MAG TPA: ASKHA domain-containing protein [Steroidobacteraceae bacterium]|nr:ASKHA domain-containing protein [Steroidobacteraceae bacterium]